MLGQAWQDYVTVILTDREDLDVLDMQDKLRTRLSLSAEIRREGIRRADYTNRRTAAKEPILLNCAVLFWVIRMRKTGDFKGCD